jgi:hypothetical protein
MLKLIVPDMKHRAVILVDTVRIGKTISILALLYAYNTVIVKGLKVKDYSKSVTNVTFR